MEPEDRLDELAGSVVDGAPVDWDGVETRAELDDESRSIRALRDLSRIAAFNRALQSTRPGLPRGAAPGTPLTASPAIGQWGPFTLLEPVGAGATGEVWRAWDASLQRDVAIKFLQAKAASDGGVSPTLLLEEARAVARVRHPGVVTVYGIAEHDGRAGMWMEFLRGPTLASEIDRRGGLPARDVARIGLQLTEALDALERAGLVHRDLKPANVVLESDGRAVLTDFGLGWRRSLLDENAPRGLGTPLFMTPGLLAGDPPTPRSDIYALGVTLRWALTGRPPFRARSLEELKVEAAGGPAVALAKEAPGAPDALVSAIERAMDGSAEARHFTAREFGDLLRFALDETETDPGRAAPRAHALPPSAPVLSIAVLPFVNHSRDEEEEYFSDGLADELLNVLAKIRGVRVASRTSSFLFKGTSDDVATIGRKLNVATLLEGGVRRSGKRIRISVRLVKVVDGYQLWSETYDRTLDDIFALQDDIAQSALKELRTALLGADAAGTADADVKAEVAAAARGRGESGEAHRLFLQGRHFVDRGSREYTTKGIEFLQRALELDPTHALAWSELSRARMNEANAGWGSVEDAVARARAAAERALALVPDLPDALARLGSLKKNWDWDWRGAEACYRRALELAPGSAVVLDGAGVLAETLGRLDEAIELMRRALEKDPLSAGGYSNIGVTYHAAGRLREAEEATRRAIELAPQRIVIHSSLALILLDQGRWDEALQEANREPEEVFRLWALAIVHHAAGRRRESDDAMQALVAGYAEGWAYQAAEAYAARGQSDEAFHWLESAYAQRDAGLSYLKPDPLLRSLHGDPRWPVLLAKLGLAE
ncbi:MAG TPA: protein kinase [Candidatus Eisenbacteria bacterium]|nr:protein kinase [Candidatus Eisenbacteria bacterium]